MTRLDSSDTGSFSQTRYQSEEPLSQQVTEKISSHWNNQIEELRKKDDDGIPESTAGIEAADKPNGSFLLTRNTANAAAEPEGQESPKDKGSEVDDRKKNEKKGLFSDYAKPPRGPAYPESPKNDRPDTPQGPGVDGQKPGADAQKDKSAESDKPAQKAKSDGTKVLSNQTEMNRRARDLREKKSRTTEEEIELKALTEFPDARDTEIRLMSEKSELILKIRKVPSHLEQVKIDSALLESRRRYPRPNSSEARDLGLNVDDYTEDTAQKLRDCYKKSLANQPLTKEEQALYEAWTEFPPTPPDVDSTGTEKRSALMFTKWSVHRAIGMESLRPPRPVFQDPKEGAKLREIAVQEKLKPRIPDEQYIKLEVWRSFPDNAEARKLLTTELSDSLNGRPSSLTEEQRKSLKTFQQEKEESDKRRSQALDEAWRRNTLALGLGSKWSGLPREIPPSILMSDLFLNRPKYPAPVAPSKDGPSREKEK